MKNEGLRELRKSGSGYSFEAPGIYIWDEDPREVARAALELRLGNARPRPTRRMLVIPPQDVVPAAR